MRYQKLVLEVSQGQEAFWVHGSTTDQTTVDVFFAHQFLNVGRLDGTTVLNADVLAVCSL